MTRKWLITILLVCAGIPPLSGRDFLTPNEADQIRLMQEPNGRLQLYVQFARQRVELLEYMLSKEQAGRSSRIHENLEDYTRIIEAIDTVADDALLRGEEIDKGIEVVADAEKDFLDVLRKVQASKPRDMERYRFVLATAIETTFDSLEISLEDLHDRRIEAASREKRESEKLEELTTPENVEERRKQEKETAEAEAEEKRKIPSLYREGEKEQEQKQK